MGDFQGPTVYLPEGISVLISTSIPFSHHEIPLNRHSITIKSPFIGDVPICSYGFLLEKYVEKPQITIKSPCLGDIPIYFPMVSW